MTMHANIELNNKQVSSTDSIEYGPAIDFTNKTRFNSEKNWNGKYYETTFFNKTKTDKNQFSVFMKGLTWGKNNPSSAGFFLSFDKKNSDEESDTRLSMLDNKIGRRLKGKYYDQMDGGYMPLYDSDNKFPYNLFCKFSSEFKYQYHDSNPVTIINEYNDDRTKTESNNLDTVLDVLKSKTSSSKISNVEVIASLGVSPQYKNGKKYYRLDFNIEKLYIIKFKDDKSDKDPIKSDEFFEEELSDEDESEEEESNEEESNEEESNEEESNE
jgi:hypothetical protein